MSGAVVIVEWANSSPTVTGPFDSLEAAEAWAIANAEPMPAVTRWAVVELFSPLFDATGWLVLS